MRVLLCLLFIIIVHLFEMLLHTTDSTPFVQLFNWHVIYSYDFNEIGYLKMCAQTVNDLVAEIYSNRVYCIVTISIIVAWHKRKTIEL